MKKDALAPEPVEKVININLNSQSYRFDSLSQTFEFIKGSFTKDYPTSRVAEHPQKPNNLPGADEVFSHTELQNKIIRDYLFCFITQQTPSFIAKFLNSQISDIEKEMDKIFPFPIKLDYKKQVSKGELTSHLAQIQTVLLQEKQNKGSILIRRGLASDTQTLINERAKIPNGIPPAITSDYQQQYINISTHMSSSFQSSSSTQQPSFSSFPFSTEFPPYPFSSQEDNDSPLFGDKTQEINPADFYDSPDKFRFKLNDNDERNYSDPNQLYKDLRGKFTKEYLQYLANENQTKKTNKTDIKLNENANLQSNTLFFQLSNTIMKEILLCKITQNPNLLIKLLNSQHYQSSSDSDEIKNLTQIKQELIAELSKNKCIQKHYTLSDQTYQNINRDGDNSPTITKPTPSKISETFTLEDLLNMGLDRNKLGDLASANFQGKKEKNNFLNEKRPVSIDHITNLRNWLNTQKDLYSVSENKNKPNELTVSPRAIDVKDAYSVTVKKDSINATLDDSKSDVAIEQIVQLYLKSCEGQHVTNHVIKTQNPTLRSKFEIELKTQLLKQHAPKTQSQITCTINDQKLDKIGKSPTQNEEDDEYNLVDNRHRKNKY